MANTTSVPSTSGTFKEQGNDEYGKGNFLKAAALYSRAIKEDPDNAALYSNRSAALLQIHKVSKALTDADRCIQLRPEWDKGHFRRGAALEAMGMLDEALKSYQQAALHSPGSKQIGGKVRNVQKLVRQKQAGAAVNGT